MPVSELIFGSILVTGLLAVAGAVGWVQVRALVRLRTTPALPDEERTYERRRAWRWIVGSALMALMAALLVAQFILWEWRIKHLVQPVPAEEKVYVRLWGGALVALLLALLAVVILTAFDLMATRSHYLKQYRKLRADRRAMIERQAERLRAEREGDPDAHD